MLNQFDTGTANTLEGEVNLSLENPFEIRNLQQTLQLDGLKLIASPSSALDHYMPYIRATLCTRARIGREFEGRPEHLSHELYGTHDLWHLLMDLNGIAERRLFVGPTVIVLDPTRETEFKRVIYRIKQSMDRLGKAPRVIKDITVREVPST